MSDTHEALRAHLKKWRAEQRKLGMETNPLGELEESVRFLCARIDATREAFPTPEDLLNWSEGRLP
jgi:hypothetical protein